MKVEVEVFKCDRCKFVKRKDKNPRCFECFNSDGYIVGLINDATKDRMVHPICAFFNKRFEIKDPKSLGISLFNKFNRQLVDD